MAVLARLDQRKFIVDATDELVFSEELAERTVLALFDVSHEVADRKVRRACLLE